MPTSSSPLSSLPVLSEGTVRASLSLLLRLMQVMGGRREELFYLFRRFSVRCAGVRRGTQQEQEGAVCLQSSGRAAETSPSGWGCFRYPNLCEPTGVLTMDTAPFLLSSMEPVPFLTLV